MPSAVSDVWVYLSANPLLWLSATMLAYVIGHWLYVKSGENPAVNSVAIAVVILIALLWATDSDFRRRGTRDVAWLTQAWSTTFGDFDKVKGESLSLSQSGKPSQLVP